MIKVFKFGGASVKDGDSVKNVATIINTFSKEDDHLIVVVSAMGKTTNALEGLMDFYALGDQDGIQKSIKELKTFHEKIIHDLFSNTASGIGKEIDKLFDTLLKKCLANSCTNYDYEYDQIISLGEIVSTKIIGAYLEKMQFNAKWIDARKLIRTDNRWREAKVDWEISERLIKAEIKLQFEKEKHTIAITQGFLGHTFEGSTTTLGREGSDFTASIFAYVANAKSVTIWKDVPGMLNADPRYFDNTVLLEKISFKEAIELAYFGASVIHPKTIQPLKRKNIPLYIKSFIHPEKKGSVIQESIAYDDHTPSFIFKRNQLLISLTPRDFSFIVEENLAQLFAYLNTEKIRVNLMQNSAVSFSFVVDEKRIDLKKFISVFEAEYIVKYNEDLELATIRHYDDPTILRVTRGRKILLEQKTRQTARLVIFN